MSNQSKSLWVMFVSLAFVLGMMILVIDKPTYKNQKSSRVVLGEAANKNYFISVYYFPNRKLEAQALSYFFKEHGYNVDLHTAASEPALKGSRNSPSHIFFNRGELSKAMQIKSLIEDVVGYPVNAYRFHNSQTDPSMMMVFTDGES